MKGDAVAKKATHTAASIGHTKQSELLAAGVGGVPELRCNVREGAVTRAYNMTRLVPYSTCTLFLLQQQHIYTLGYAIVAVYAPVLTYQVIIIKSPKCYSNPSFQLLKHSKSNSKCFFPLVISGVQSKTDFRSS